MKLDENGDLYLSPGRSLANSIPFAEPNLPYADFPENSTEDGYQAILCAGVDCDCFEETDWYDTDACVYPINTE
jgi:hypothetical protein